ncbi:hypothetical protein CLV47_11227 [Antricoccus suffuscus]|uniref:DUF8129 domain-containing protein n=1 Tax=Antricoccus suffuscus TaxID=1629062 RepID=A0A2T0ZXI8_9ACTN|nr:lipid droplet-associated protein [Antricoccus suffuscus]PRZ40994.1 hypothetical protein CLV47_11227 [Antricoccus suffuscus]
MSQSKLPPSLSALLAVDLPTPLKAAAGLAVQALEDARALPDRISGLPMALVTAVMQRSLQAQQQYTELVTKGEQLINTLRGPSEEVPEWATFDEDLPEVAPRTTRQRTDTGTPKTHTDPRPAAPKKAPAKAKPTVSDTRSKPRNRVRPPGIGPGSSFDQQALEDMPIARRRTRSPKSNGTASDAPVAGFDDMTLPQIRARVKSFDAATLQALVVYETAQGNRAPVLKMLATRLTALKPQG